MSGGAYLSNIEPGPDFQLPSAMGLEPTKQLRLKYSHSAKGIVLRDKNGIVYVPYEATRGGWYAVTLHDPKGVYPPGGYNILVPNQEITTSTIVSVDGVPLTDELTEEKS